MNQTGVRSTGCDLQARTKRELGADMNRVLYHFSLLCVCDAPPRVCETECARNLKSMSGIRRNSTAWCEKALVTFLVAAGMGLLFSGRGVEAHDGKPPTTPTFYKDVLPILQEKCQSCHRPGEAAPMPLVTYEQTRPWARKMATAVEMKMMPPWFADPRYGHFANDP